MVNKHLKSFGLIQGASVITGLVLASLLSTFLLQHSPSAAISENSPVSFLLYLLPGIALLLIYSAARLLDGLRVDFPDGWGLVSASNTEPALTLRFEADSDDSLEDIKSAFRELLQEVKPDLNFE
ncbi:MAG: hypothetical protein ACNYPE_01055 [Candidatus Azotimanducaceae bacterium WSBS_2022_MAG_OTU7]